MSMTCHFFISADLDELERLEQDLERASIVTPQIHVLSLDDTGMAMHRHLHAVMSFMKKDVIHSTILGAIVGLCAAILIVAGVYMAGWSETPAGWTPFVLLAIVVLGFFTWEGGLHGIQVPNGRFQRFRRVLDEGKHLLFVDLEPKQERILEAVINKYPTVEAAGEGRGAPHWFALWQYRVKRFFVETFP